MIKAIQNENKSSVLRNKIQQDTVLDKINKLFSAFLNVN